MYIHRLLYSTYSSLIISILLGFGFATMFRKECKDGTCIVLKGAPFKKIKNKVYLHNNSCHQFSPSSVSCDKSKKQIDFA